MIFFRHNVFTNQTCFTASELIILPLDNTLRQCCLSLVCIQTFMQASQTIYVLKTPIAISEMHKVSLREGFVDSIKADTFSLAAFEISLFGWMAIVALVIFGTTWHANPTEPVF